MEARQTPNLMTLNNEDRHGPGLGRVDNTGLKRHIKVLQINLNNCSDAHDLLMQTLVKKGTDIAIVCEPYLKKSQGRWVVDDTGKTAIWVKDAKTARVIEPKVDGITGVRIGDVSFFSCYFSPNTIIPAYEQYLIRLGGVVEGQKRTVVAGDFNAKSVMWEESGGRDKYERDRVEATENFIAFADLHIGNIGNKPTCIRDNGTSIVDISLATQDIGFQRWKVLDEHTGSDHQYIEYDILHGPATSAEPGVQKARTCGWKITDEAILELERALKTNFELLGQEGETSAEESARKYVDMVTKTCNDVLRPRIEGAGRRSVYWWNEDIAEKRRACVNARRELKKFGKDEASSGARNKVLEDLREKRKELRLAIRDSKAGKWKELLADLDRDPWSKSYQIVLNKIGGEKVSSADPEQTVRELFPRDDADWYGETAEEAGYVEDEEVHPFMLGELEEAMSAVKKKKSPGPDNIVGDIAKACFRANPVRLLNLYNKCLKEKTFPSVWKIGKLVLIPKPNSTKSRPITMLSVFGKIYERLINNRIKRELEERKSLSENQYGFREGKSTGGALKALKKKMSGAKARRQFCVVVSFDVRNAFNTIRWGNILLGLKKAGLSKYLRDIVREYGNGRTLTYIGSDGQERTYVTNRGVPQGSVLGPTLWIIAYNEVLLISARKGSETESVIIGFADDTLLIVTGRNHVKVEDEANRLIKVIGTEVNRLGCSFAPEKTQVIFVSPKRKVKSITIVVDGTVVDITKSFKYLGVIVDNALTFKEHVSYVTDKAKKVSKKLAGLMRNLHGPKEKRRKLYTTVVNQILLYASPIWGTNLAKTHRNKLNQAQRLANIRQISGYITVSQESAAALSGNPPADLLAEEAARIELVLRKRPRARTNAQMLAAKKVRLDEREKTCKAWNNRWKAEVSNWTKKLCTDLSKVERKHLHNSFRTTQLLTGKGVFNEYRKAIGKSRTDKCWYCPNEVDSAEHTMFTCPKWIEERNALKEDVHEFKPDGELLTRLTACSKSWKAFSKFADSVMSSKEEEERRIEARVREERRRARRANPCRAM